MKRILQCARSGRVLWPVGPTTQSGNNQLRSTGLSLVAALLAIWLPAAGAQARHGHHSAEKAPSARSGAQLVPVTFNTGTGLERFKRFTADEPVKEWREVNRTVAEIGGWQVYAQEAARAIKAEQDAKPAQKESKP